MEEINIIKYKSKHINLGELSQSMSVKFSILKPIENGYEQITPAVKCRDFLCDVYTASLENYNFELYGMSYDSTVHKPSWDGVYLLLLFPNEKIKQQFYENIHFIHNIEDKNGVARSEIFDISARQAIIVGHKTWLNSVLSFSFYTLLIRVFCYAYSSENWIDELINEGKTDSQYFKNFPRSSLDKILNDLQVLNLKPWCGLSFLDKDRYSVHSNSGVIALFSQSTESSVAVVKQNLHYKQIKKLGLETYIQ